MVVVDLHIAHAILFFQFLLKDLHIILIKAISAFVERHPTIKMLALSFLILIGVMLVVEGFGKHVEKGYIYFAMAFSVFVEMLNLRMRAKRRQKAPVTLRQPFTEGHSRAARPEPDGRRKKRVAPRATGP